MSKDRDASAELALTGIELEFNWPAMYSAFARGSSLDEISMTFACPLPLLRRASTQQGWAELAEKTFPIASKPRLGQNDHARFVAIEANRKANLDMARTLRATVVRHLEALQEDRLMVERVNVSKGLVTVTPTKPTPSDILAYANAAKVTADITYAALGDRADSGGVGKKSSDDPPSAITVILPSVVVANRERKVSRVIDLTDASIPESTDDA
jgi:hypothetical protein